jgi:hypothetical protein
MSQNKQTTPLFDSQEVHAPIPQIVPSETLGEEVERNLLHEYEETPDRPDIVIANHLIRGMNRNTELTIKVKRGLEHLHSKSAKEDCGKRIQMLEDRNSQFDRRVEKISDYLTGAFGWWAINTLKIIALCFTLWILESLAVTYLHKSLPANLTTP